MKKTNLFLIVLTVLFVFMLLGCSAETGRPDMTQADLELIDPSAPKAVPTEEQRVIIESINSDIDTWGEGDELKNEIMNLLINEVSIESQFVCRDFSFSFTLPEGENLDLDTINPELSFSFNAYHCGDFIISGDIKFNFNDVIQGQVTVKCGEKEWVIDSKESFDSFIDELKTDFVNQFESSLNTLLTDFFGAINAKYGNGKSFYSANYKLTITLKLDNTNGVRKIKMMGEIETRNPLNLGANSYRLYGSVGLDAVLDEANEDNTSLMLYTNSVVSSSGTYGENKLRKLSVLSIGDELVSYSCTVLNGQLLDM